MARGIESRIMGAGIEEVGGSSYILNFFVLQCLISSLNMKLLVSAYF